MEVRPVVSLPTFEEVVGPPAPAPPAHEIEGALAAYQAGFALAEGADRTERGAPLLESLRPRCAAAARSTRARESVAQLARCHDEATGALAVALTEAAEAFADAYAAIRADMASAELGAAFALGTALGRAESRARFGDAIDLSAARADAALLGLELETFDRTRVSGAAEILYPAILYLRRRYEALLSP